jgi:hypothetical protein
MMESGAIARFAGITAYGDRFRGLGWHMSDLIGWTEAPDVVRERIKRSRAAGTFRTPAFLDERVVRVPGFLVAASHSDLEDQAEQFRGLITRVITLSIETPRGRRWVSGTVTQAAFENHVFAPEGQWVLEVTCEDPRKYGDVHRFPAGTPVFHRGNVDAWSVHTVTSAVEVPGGYTITGPNGRIIKITYPVVPGWPHRIDTATGILTVNGTPVNNYVTVWQPWSIPPGPAAFAHTITAGVVLETAVTDTLV